MNCPTCGAAGYSKGSNNEVDDIVKKSTSATNKLKNLKPMTKRPDELKTSKMTRGGRFARD